MGIGDLKDFGRPNMIFSFMHQDREHQKLPLSWDDIET